MPVIYKQKESAFDSTKIKSALHRGRIGEYLVAADILLGGYECFQSAPGMAYDLVADINGTLLRVQVKTTATLSAIRNDNESSSYVFNINYCGSGGKIKYNPTDFDLVAMVILPEKSVGYISSKDIPGHFRFRSEDLRGTYFDEKINCRNGKLLEDITAGISLQDISVKYKVKKESVYAILESIRTKKEQKGRYLKDFTLTRALVSIGVGL